MNTKALFIAAGSMLFTMILVTNWMWGEMQASRDAGGAVDAGFADPAAGQPVQGGMVPDGDPIAGPTDASGLADLNAAQSSALACFAESGSYASCAAGLPPTVTVESASDTELVFGSTGTDGTVYKVRLDVNGTCHYTALDTSSCAVW